jgi:hypothetical protein
VIVNVCNSSLQKFAKTMVLNAMLMITYVEFEWKNVKISDIVEFEW